MTNRKLLYMVAAAAARHRRCNRTLATSYLLSISSTPGGAAEMSWGSRYQKTFHILHPSAKHIFVPVALETVEHVSAEGLHFLEELGEWCLITESHLSFLNCFLSLSNGSMWSFSVALSPQRQTSKFSRSRLAFNVNFVILGIYTIESKIMWNKLSK